MAAVPYVCDLHLVFWFSSELMKSWASSVISSKLSSSNSHWAAVTKARVSASLLPWNGDSPLSLPTREKDREQFQPVSTRGR